MNNGIYSESWKPVSEARIAEIQPWLPEKPSGFGVPISDRSFWDSKAVREALALGNHMERAEALLAVEYPPWVDEAYLEFSRTGKRPGGERMLGDRQKWLMPLVMAEILENKGRFLPAIEKVLAAQCDQPSWVLPAHDRNLRVFKGEGHFVELNSAPWGHELAQTLYLLGDRLAPSVRDRVKARVFERVLNPVRSNMESGEGTHWWLRGDNNWNVVCWQGCLGAAMALVAERKDRAWWVAAAEDGSRYYVEAKADDGYDTEGAGYWAYAMDNFNGLRENVLRVTGGRLDLYSPAKVRNAALFGARIAMNGGYAPPYGDCRINTRVNEGVLGYLDQSLGLGLGLPPVPRLGNLVSICADLSSNSTVGKKDHAASSEDRNRSYFPDAGVLVCRDLAAGARLSASIKGGGNQNHNHNDVGSFVIQLGSSHMAGDCGGPWAYNGDMFGPKRWSYKSLNSFGHPVPVFAGEFQVDSRKAKPVVLSNRFSEEVDEILYDLKSAYEGDKLLSWTRRFRFDRRGAGEVTVEDRFSFSSPETVELGLPTFCDVEPSGKDAVRLTSVSTEWKQTAPGNYVLGTPTSPSNRRSMLVTVESPDGFSMTREDIEVNAPPYHRLGFVLNKPLQRGVTRMIFRPEGGSPSPKPGTAGLVEKAKLPWSSGPLPEARGNGSYAGVDAVLPSPIPYPPGSSLSFELECQAPILLNAPALMLTTEAGKVAYVPIGLTWKEGTVRGSVRLPEKPGTHPSAKSPGTVAVGDSIFKIRLYCGLSKPVDWRFAVKSLSWDPPK